MGAPSTAEHTQRWQCTSRARPVRCALPNSAQTRDSHSTREAGAGLHRPQPCPPRHPEGRLPGLGVPSRSSATAHRNPPQPSAAFPSPRPIPQARPGPARPRPKRRAPTPPARLPSAEESVDCEPAIKAHRFPSLTMATPGTHQQQRLPRRSRPPSGDGVSRAPPSLAPPSEGSGFSIGPLQVSRGFGKRGRRRCVVDGVGRD